MLPPEHLAHLVFVLVPLAEALCDIVESVASLPGLMLDVIGEIAATLLCLLDGEPTRAA